MNTEQRQYTTNTYVNMRRAFLTIARVLDFVGVDDIYHSHRVAYIAYECGKLLNWSPLHLEKTFYAGLLHDCGISSSKEHLRLLAGMSPSNVDEHCERGYNALNENALLCSFADIVRHHHTPWRELKDLDLDNESKEITALIHLSEQVDFLRSRYAHETHPEAIILCKDAIEENIRSKKDSFFQPEFADAMVRLVNIDGFWFAMDYERIESIGLKFKTYKPFNTILDILQIKELALFLAKIVDAKSAFTFHHSQKVAQIAKMLALDSGLNETNSDMVFVAGLLHDIGKLRTPDEILNKIGPLEEIELSIMKRHPVDTMITLDHFFPDSKIGQWAANHHEKLDGSGYPYQLTGKHLDLESRIIAIADIFQALSQTRPYRNRLSLLEIIQIMEPMVSNGKIDGDVFQLIILRGDEYYQASTL